MASVRASVFVCKMCMCVSGCFCNVHVCHVCQMFVYVCNIFVMSVYMNLANVCVRVHYMCMSVHYMCMSVYMYLPEHVSIFTNKMCMYVRTF